MSADKMRDFAESYLCCPDDHSGVILTEDKLECVRCGRKFAILADGFFEMLPSEFPGWGDGASERAEEVYSGYFREPFSWDTGAPGWGDLGSASPGTRCFYKEGEKKILELLKPDGDAVAVDVSGAVGNYSVSLSGRLRTMVNCDLHAPSIAAAYRNRSGNMVCVRAPYLRLPFRPGVFDYAVCTDTLERGPDHEIRLLREIKRILKPGGRAVVDFHNRKWYSKNTQARGYSLAEISGLLHGAGIKEYSVTPLGYVPQRLVPSEGLYPLMDGLFRFLLPCHRHVVSFEI